MNFLDLREPVSTWSHFAGLFLALPGTVLLWQRSLGAPAKRLSMLVYGVTLAFCYLASTLYHGVRLPAAEIATFARLDSVGIFGLIAGSYTPIACGLLHGLVALCTLAIVWGVARYGDGLDFDGTPPLVGAVNQPVPRDGLGRGRLLLQDRARCLAQSVAAHHPRWRILQYWRRPQPDSLARSLPWDFQHPRVIPLLRAGGKSAALSVYSQSSRAVCGSAMSRWQRESRAALGSI